MSRAGRRRLVVETDGGSRGNPGVAGYGALVRDARTGSVLVELAQPLGQASNNVAEYSGLIAGLRAALDIDATADVEVQMDSKLVIEQMSGRWKIKHEDMRRLALEARDLCSRFSSAGGSTEFRWVPREQNKAADALSNEGMDGHRIRRVHSAKDSERHAAGRAVVGLRLLLVQEPADDSQAAAVAAAALELVGEGAKVIAATGRVAQDVATRIAAVLSVEVTVSEDWASPSGTRGADERVRAAYHSLVDEGGTVAVVTSRRGVLTVLAEVLGLTAERFWAMATAPGSLTAVEVWPDGTASVEFTNRTTHLL